MAKKNADKIDPAAKARAPRRPSKRNVNAGRAAGDGTETMSTAQRAEASEMAAPPLTSGTTAEARTTDNSPAGSDPSYDDIARAAYDRYLSRGGNHGRDFDDWLEAEQDLRKR